MSKVKIIIFSILAIIISFFLTAFTKEEANYYGAQTIYRVYLNGESIGLIKNPDKLEQYINDEQQQIKNKYNVDKVHIPKGLEIKQELTYNEKIKDEKTIYNEIKDVEPFTIEGYVVTIYKEDTTVTEDGEHGPIIEETDEITALKIYVLEKEIFEEAINSTIYAFIDEEEYLAYVDETQTPLKELEAGEIIENVYLKEEVYIKKDYISVSEEIFTDSRSLAKYLLYGEIKEEQTYIVKLGDTIKEIAYNNKLNVREFLIANRDIASEDTLLYPGQKVVVNLINPILTVVQETKENLFQDKDFKTEVIEDSSYMVGYSKVVQNGVKGQEFITRITLLENGKVISVKNLESIETKAPINRVVKTGSRTEFAIGNTGLWAWPTRSGYYISTYYGADYDLGYYRFHAALDITGTGCGSPIYAANDGTVSVSYAWKGTISGQDQLGNFVTINHNNGYTTTYAHLSKRYVSAGQAVEMGQIIGTMGNTGYSFGCHLHYVTKYNGKTFNPFDLYK